MKEAKGEKEKVRGEGGGEGGERERERSTQDCGNKPWKRNKEERGWRRVLGW